MRGRTLFLFVIALLLAGGTAFLVRSWLTQRPAVVAAAAPPPARQKSILVARLAIARGQILKPTDFAARPWPAAGIAGDFILAGAETEKSLAGSVAREPFAAGEPIIRTKIVTPGDRGFLAAVLHPGMRAVSVPVTATSGVSGFVFPGDRVDILITLPVPASGANSGGGAPHKAAETVLRNVRVIAIDQRLDVKEGQAVLARTVTFEVTPKQSEIIALAGEMGQLSLSLRSLAVSSGESPRDSSADPRPDSLTLDSQLLPKPLTSNQNPGDGIVTILRGNGNSSTSSMSQPASRGS